MSDIRIDDLIELIKGWGNPNTLNLHLTPAMMLVDRVSYLEKERDELKSKLDLIRKVAIPNSQGNCIVPTDLIYGEVST
jgi:hypothetical protein